MWSYYGAKTNIVDYYPSPVHDTIIEPFAGSARYALKYFEKDVVLVDKYEIVAKVWKWLQLCSPNDILSLPIPAVDKTTHDYNYDCEEAKWLVGFIIRFGAFSPSTKITSHYAVHRKNGVSFSLNRIANNLYKIKHWQISHGCFKGIENKKATWFIDPPYQHGGHAYVESNKNIDFADLAVWCKLRNGQVIVCESLKAEWLDFQPLCQQRTRTGMQNEAMWHTEDNPYYCDDLLY